MLSIANNIAHMVSGATKLTSLADGNLHVRKEMKISIAIPILPNSSEQRCALPTLMTSNRAVK